MKMGMRKPSIKKSFKARTTGKAKRAVKKAVIPGYGKKGMGWVKDPKRAAYNKVYNKTTFGVNDVVRAASAGSSPKKKSSSSSRKSSVRSTSPSTSSKTVSSSQIKLDYNVLAKDKPTIAEPIIVGIIGIAIVLLISRFIGLLICIGALYLLYDYEHRSNTKDFIPDEDFNNWLNVIRKYYGSIPDNTTYSQALDYTKKIMSDRYENLKKYYDELSNQKTLSQKHNLSLIENSNAVLDFEKYVTYKIADVRFLPDRIHHKYEQAIQNYIDVEYQKAADHAATLKTEKGKLNQIAKYKETVTENLSSICSNFSDYMNLKVDEDDFYLPE